MLIVATERFPPIPFPDILDSYRSLPYFQEIVK